MQNLTPVSVGTTATQIVPAADSRWGYVVHNAGPDTIFIGGPGVTAANGIPLPSGENLELAKLPGALGNATQFALHAICAATTTATARILVY